MHESSPGDMSNRLIAWYGQSPDEASSFEILREEVVAKQSLANTDANITAIGGKLGCAEARAYRKTVHQN